MVKRLAATKPNRSVIEPAVYSAQAAEIMLDPIAHSDGTRAGVARALRATYLSNRLIGPVTFGRRPAPHDPARPGTERARW